MPDVRRPSTNNDLEIKLEVLIQKVDGMDDTIKQTAGDVRGLREANFIRPADFSALIEKFQDSFATKQELLAVNEKLKEIQDERVWLNRLVVGAVVAALVSLVVGARGGLGL